MKNIRVFALKTCARICSRGKKSVSVALLMISVLFHASTASSQYQWRYVSELYPTRAEAISALKSDPDQLWNSLTSKWFTSYSWSSNPPKITHYYNMFEYQPFEVLDFVGYGIRGSYPSCYQFGDPRCFSTVEEAVAYSISGYPQLCDFSFNELENWEYDNDWIQEVFEEGIRYIAIETSTVVIDIWNIHANGQCEHSITYNYTLEAAWFVECNQHMGITSSIGDRISDGDTSWPNLCSGDSHLLPLFDFQAPRVRRERVTNVCTPTEGNPCSPSSGNKTLREEDYSSDYLNVTRFYNSALESELNEVGQGWNHTYSAQLSFDGVRYTHVMPNGNLELFKSAANGDYRSIVSFGKIIKRLGDTVRILYPGGKQEVFQLATTIDDGAGDPVEIFRLSEIYPEDWPDSRIQLIYDPVTNLLMSVTDPLRRQIHFEYDADARVSAVLLPDGLYIDYVHNTNGNLKDVIYQNGSIRSYEYEIPALPNHLTGIIDENGDRLATYGYDQYGRVTLSEHAGGANRVTLNYVADGSTEVTTPSGDLRTYNFNQYTPSFEIDDISDGNGAKSYVRNTDGWVTEETDSRGYITRYSYDEFHRTQVIQAFGEPEERTVNYDWDDNLNRQTEIDELQTLTNFEYDLAGRLESKTVIDKATFAERKWNYTYFDVPAIPELIGQVQTIDGPRTDVSDITTYEYFTTDHPAGDYLKGDLKAVVNALGHRTDYLKYDANGRALEIQDANGVPTTLGYHPRGWISSRTTDSKTTSFSYDLAGNLIRVTQADGSFMDYEYDDAHRLNAMEDNFGNRIEYTLDAEGNRTEERTYDDIGVLKRQLNRIYNQLNQLTDLIDGNSDVTSFGYDNNGNRASTTDANLNPTTFEYDALDRLTKTIDALLGETLMDYDDRDNLVSVTDPLDNVTQYIYDGLDNQTQLDSPDTGITTYEHDDAGNRTAATDARGIRVEYDYDAHNRLTDITYPDSSLDVTFTYDVGPNGIGRLTGMSDAAGTVTYSYDAQGNLVTESRTIGGELYITSYQYNDADRLTQITYPSGMIVDYTLDAAGRIVAVDKTEDSVTEALVTNITYEPFGPVSGFTYANGLTMDGAFDLDYELDQLTAGSLNWVFGYDAAGNLLTIDDQIWPADSQTFTYDVVHRLDTASGSYGSEDFDYDANGNRTFYQGPVTEIYTYEPQSNRLASQGVSTFARDAAGNRTEKLDTNGHGQLYSFGDHNRLSQTLVRDAQGDSIVGTYLYDGHGQRVRKTANGSTTHFIYGLNGKLLAEYVVGDVDQKEYVYLNGQPIAAQVRRVELIQPPGPEFIMDNDDPDTSSTGSWSLKSNVQAYGPNHREARKSASNTYTWTFTQGSPSSTYRVWARWISHNSYSSQVDYQIAHMGGTQLDTVTVDQSTGGGQWHDLGEFNFWGGGPEWIEINAAIGKTSADAIKFEEILEPIFGETDRTYFIHTDHLGTPRQATDSTGAVVWRWDSRPFGDSAPDEDPDGNSTEVTLNLRFPGQYHDAESGLHYNYFRTYDPEIGRYVESDPVGLEGGANPFSYVLNSPIQFLDPFGLKVSGEWAPPPKFNITNYGTTGGEFISPYLNMWGYLQVFRIYGFAAGFVNIDVKCKNTDNCSQQEWEVHWDVPVEYHGHKDIGPNAAASAVGAAAGGVPGAVTAIATAGGAALHALHSFLREVEAIAGDEIRLLYERGPDAICLVTQK